MALSSIESRKIIMRAYKFETSDRRAIYKARIDRTKVTSGAQGRNRTTDTRIFSPLLYRLSYLGLPWLLAAPGRTRKERAF
jgi:hypothetical protein